MTPHILYRDSIQQLTVEVVDNFWEKVDTTPGYGPKGDCWAWTGCADRLGYGRLTMRPYRFLAHRFSWLLEHGVLWDDLEILHKCDFPPCIRPDHLQEGTHKENMHDCHRKGRHGYGHLHGELIGNHKLTAAQVREIRETYKGVRKGYIEIGNKYGVSATQIGYIMRNQVWADDNDVVLESRPIKVLGKGNIAKRPVIDQPLDQSYRIIPLTRGKVTFVDTNIYEWFMQWSWYAKRNQKSGSFYAVRNSRSEEGDPHIIWMHREVMQIAYGDERTVDHVKSKMTLDNRRSNLRIATKREQAFNRAMPITNTTGFKGVTRYKDRNLYMSQIGVDGKKVHLIQSDDPKVAYAAYCEAAKELHGDFARYE